MPRGKLLILKQPTDLVLFSRISKNTPSLGNPPPKHPTPTHHIYTIMALSDKNLARIDCDFDSVLSENYSQGDLSVPLDILASLVSCVPSLIGHPKVPALTRYFKRTTIHSSFLLKDPLEVSQHPFSNSDQKTHHRRCRTKPKIPPSPISGGTTKTKTTSCTPELNLKRPDSNLGILDP